MNDILSKTLDSPAQLYGISLTVIILSYVVVKGFSSSSSKSSSSHVYPPGPPRNAILGALGSFPMEKFHETFSEWGKLYGIVSVFCRFIRY
jgi:hypothetical protein